MSTNEVEPSINITPVPTLVICGYPPSGVLVSYVSLFPTCCLPDVKLLLQIVAFLIIYSFQSRPLIIYSTLSCVFLHGTMDAVQICHAVYVRSTEDSAG